MGLDDGALEELSVEQLREGEEVGQTLLRPARAEPAHNRRQQVCVKGGPWAAFVGCLSQFLWSCSTVVFFPPVGVVRFGPFKPWILNVPPMKNPRQGSSPRPCDY